MSLRERKPHEYLGDLYLRAGGLYSYSKLSDLSVFLVGRAVTKEGIHRAAQNIARGTVRYENKKYQTFEISVEY